MEEKTKIRIGGMKFSEELAHLTVLFPAGDKTSFAGLLRLLSGRQINIPFICHSHEVSCTKSSFCVLRNDLGKVQETLHHGTHPLDDIDIIPSVGTLTLFPHRNSFRLLGLVLKTVADYDYPIHSLGTSISAIAVNTDFRLLDEMAEKLSEGLALPENHAPFRQEFRLTQQY